GAAGAHVSRADWRCDGDRAARDSATLGDDSGHAVSAFVSAGKYRRPRGAICLHHLIVLKDVGTALVSLPRIGEERGLLARGETERMDGARPGSPPAWDELIARHNHTVMVALLARGIRIDRAREAAQEAWARLIARQREGRLERLVLPGLAVVQ